MIRAAYPNAVLLPHPLLENDQIERLCKAHGLRLTQTRRGFVYFESSPTPIPASLEPSLSNAQVGAAAGPDAPRVA